MRYQARTSKCGAHSQPSGHHRHPDLDHREHLYLIQAFLASTTASYSENAPTLHDVAPHWEWAEPINSCADRERGDVQSTRPSAASLAGPRHTWRRQSSSTSAGPALEKDHTSSLHARAGLPAMGRGGHQPSLAPRGQSPPAAPTYPSHTVNIPPASPTVWTLQGLHSAGLAPGTMPSKSRDNKPIGAGRPSQSIILGVSWSGGTLLEIESAVLAAAGYLQQSHPERAGRTGKLSSTCQSRAPGHERVHLPSTCQSSAPGHGQG